MPINNRLYLNSIAPSEFHSTEFNRKNIMFHQHFKDWKLINTQACSHTNIDLFFAIMLKGKGYALTSQPSLRKRMSPLSSSSSSSCRNHDETYMPDVALSCHVRPAAHPTDPRHKMGTWAQRFLSTGPQTPAILLLYRVNKSKGRKSRRSWPTRLPPPLS